MTDTAPGLLLGEIRMRGYRNGAHGALAGRLSDCAAIDVPRLLAAVDAVLALHRPHRIYDECDHAHEDRAGVIDCGEFLTCEDSYMYSICRECCTLFGHQTEQCAGEHEHGRDDRICPTYRAVSAALEGDGTRLATPRGDDDD